jgi:acyl-CoA thioesterase-1
MKRVRCLPPLVRSAAGRCLTPLSIRRLRSVLLLALTFLWVANAGPPVRTPVPYRPHATFDGSRPTLAVEPQRPVLKLLFVGASITVGYYASSLNHAYPELVAAQLTAEGWPVDLDVEAQGGTIAHTADRWRLAVPSDVDVLVVQLATNDYLKSLPLVAYEGYYQDILRHLRAASPRARLLCLGGWDDPNRLNRLGVPASRYDAAAEAACVSQGGRYVDLSAIYLDPRNHGPRKWPTFLGPRDLFHPNDRGHRLLAQVVLQNLDLPGSPGSPGSAPGPASRLPAPGPSISPAPQETQGQYIIRGSR